MSNNRPTYEVELNAPIQEGHESTWADKRSLCYKEGASAADNGQGAESNPYVKGTWPNYWWNQAYLDFFEPHQIH